MRARRLSPDDGFSLAEVCVAAGLVATALVTLAALFSAAIDAMLIARERSQTSLHAQQKLEELIAPDGEVQPQAGAEGLDQSGVVVDAGDVEGHALFERRWRVQPAVGGPPGRVLEVEGARRSPGARAPARSRIITLRQDQP
jgi:hypothetical protein